VGKTETVNKLFDSGYEIINADSMQVYRYLDIGTDKPSRQALERIKYHLIDLVEPSFQFNAGMFVHHTEDLIRVISGRRKVPVVVGGTAFYLRSFIFGLPASPPGDRVIKEELKQLCVEKGNLFLYSKLKEVDARSAEKIAAEDTYRIIRALEIFRVTGQPLSSFQVPTTIRRDYNFLLIGLNREREELYKRIDSRVDRMFERGLVKEIVFLLEMDCKRDDPGMQGIGYREFFEMQKGCLSIEGVRELIKRNSRRYAKRQLTFFRSLPEVLWFDPGRITGIRETISRFLDKQVHESLLDYLPPSFA